MATKILLFLLGVMIFPGPQCHGFQHRQPETLKHSGVDCAPDRNRAKFLANIGAFGVMVAAAPEMVHAKSYSSNARNLERMNTGDMSGGSVYDNNPKSKAGIKRRAITGCKSPVAREEAAESILKIASLSERECNQMVLEGDGEFMLQALRKLDCPTCPYGISGSRK